MKPLLAAFTALLLPHATVAQDRAGGAWLDATPLQWNRPGASVPKPPTDAESNTTPDYCKAYAWPVSSPEERAVEGAGWIVFTSVRSDGGGIAVVGGALSEDGMCRPDPYQYLVFVRGRFAGTLSLPLMRARGDGSVNKVSFDGPNKIVAELSRYTAADPLCCPSRISEATYEIGEKSGKPTLVLIDVRTRPTA